MQFEFDARNIVHEAVQVVRIVHQQIRNAIQYDREHALSKIRVPIGNEFKDALRIDEMAEDRCREEFLDRYGEKVYVIGEESLPTELSKVHKNRICILVDMVDGTDLLEMGIPMWCSAIVIFDPTQPKILGSVVGLASGEIYSAAVDEEHAYVSRELSPDMTRQPARIQLNGPSDTKKLADATVAFYGQKAGSLLSVMACTPFIKELGRLKGNPDATFRIHTLAGNPVMVKLVDRERDYGKRVVGRGIDAVFDIRGQQLHDLVPGMFIATKAGAYACSMGGEKIAAQILAKRLMKPKETMPYILSSTPELAEELRAVLV